MGIFAGKHVSQISDIPSGRHFAIITIASVYIPGDERSRTHPGHGYPASTNHYVNYLAFTVRAEWEEQITQLTLRRESFRAIVAIPAKVETNVKVDIQ